MFILNRIQDNEYVVIHPVAIVHGDRKMVEDFLREVEAPESEIEMAFSVVEGQKVLVTPPETMHNFVLKTRLG